MWLWRTQLRELHREGRQLRREHPDVHELHAIVWKRILVRSIRWLRWQVRRERRQVLDTRNRVFRHGSVRVCRVRSGPLLRPGDEHPVLHRHAVGSQSLRRLLRQVPCGNRVRERQLRMRSWLAVLRGLTQRHTRRVYEPRDGLQTLRKLLAHMPGNSLHRGQMRHVWHRPFGLHWCESQVCRSPDRRRQLRHVQQRLSERSGVHRGQVQLPDGSDLVQRSVHQYADRRHSLRGLRHAMPDWRELRCGQVQLPRWHDALQWAVHESAGRSQELRFVRQDLPGRVLERCLHLAMRFLAS
jgi:hypothetical protein